MSFQGFLMHTEVLMLLLLLALKTFSGRSFFWNQWTLKFIKPEMHICFYDRTSLNATWMPCGEGLAEQGNISNTEEEVNILCHFIVKGFFPWSIRIVHFKQQEPRQLAKNQINFSLSSFHLLEPARLCQWLAQPHWVFQIPQCRKTSEFFSVS